MEKLIVKNFGPIREAELELRKLTVFIGEQASGKSMLAKLLGICRNAPTLLFKRTIQQVFEEYHLLNRTTEFQYSNDYYTLNYEFDFDNSKSSFNLRFISKEFNIARSDLEQIEHTLAELKDRQNYLYDFFPDAYQASEIEHKNLTNSSKEIIKIFNSIALSFVYIPVERQFFSLMSAFISSLLLNEIPLPNSLIRFGSLFEEARKSVNTMNFDPAGLSYEYKDGQDRIYVDGLNNKFAYILLGLSSSGFQSLLPLLLTITYLTKPKKDLPLKWQHRKTFIVEEPELNLFPKTQRAITEFLVEKCLSKQNLLTITTHSPYVLTSINNLIQAGNVKEMHPEVAEEIDKLIPPDQQISFDDVAVYALSDGTAKPAMDAESRLIDASIIDSVSEDIMETFDHLLDLKYQP